MICPEEAASSLGTSYKDWGGEEVVEGGTQLLEVGKQLLEVAAPPERELRVLGGTAMALSTSSGGRTLQERVQL